MFRSFSERFLSSRKTDFPFLQGHALARYIDGDIPNVTAFPDLPPKEEFAATFDGIVKALWGNTA